MKTFLTRRVRGEVLSAAAFSCLWALSALAQNSSPTAQVGPGDGVACVSPAKGIGPAPANTKQGKIIDGALSPETRQTLQEAMESTSARASDSSHPAPAAK